MLGREALITVEKALELLFHYAPFKRPCEINLAIESAYGMEGSRGGQTFLNIVTRNHYNLQRIPGLRN